MSPLVRPRSLAVLVFVVCASALAQPSDVSPDSAFVRSRAFPLPFELDPVEKAKVQQVKLYVKAEPSNEWLLHATASAAQTRYDASKRLEVGSFDVRLDHDGTFSFAVMTVNKDGSTVPATPAELRTDRRFVIDTRAPAITLKALPTKPVGDGNTVVGVEWKVEDDYLAPSSLRIEGRWFGDVGWRNFSRGLPTEPQDRREWTLRQGQRLELRLSASDRAGNQASKTILLGAGAGNVTGASAGGPGAEAGGPILGQPSYRLVNQKQINLTYRVRERPLSGLKGIELWWTRLGSKWEKYPGEFQPPGDNEDSAEISFTATDDGTYGFIMIATSGAGVASQPPPQANATPQLWVEVDSKKPEALLKTVKLANPADGRTLVLEWEAKDKNIEALPIMFYYTELDAKRHPAGEARELTIALPNTGRYVCATPQLAPTSYLFRVKMVVFDKAGNMTEVPWEKDISSDVAKPQVEIFDAKTPKGAERTPGPAPTPTPPAPAAPGGPGAPPTDPNKDLLPPAR